MHRLFKIVFNDDELDLAGDSFIIALNVLTRRVTEVVTLCGQLPLNL